MIFISNILFNLQLFDIYDAKIQYFFRIILLSHEKSAFRGIFLTIQVIFWNKQHTPETQYRITTHEIHSNIFSHFCIKWYMRFHPISLPFSQKYLFNSSVRIRPKGVKRLLFRHNICVADREEVRGFSSKNHLSHVF